MPTLIKAVNLAGAIVGQSDSVSWESIQPPPTLARQMRPQDGGGPTLGLFNESACMLMITLPLSDSTFSLAAGRWAAIPVPPLENSLKWTVLVTGGTSLYNTLLVDFFSPGEPVYDIGTLGNSPISGAISVMGQTDVDQFVISTGIFAGFSAGIGSGPNVFLVQTGVAFFKLTGGVIEPITYPTASFTTLAPSATYFLDLQPDGTYWFNTVHSPQLGYIPAYVVTTNASSNIATITFVTASTVQQVFGAGAFTLQWGPGATLNQFYNAQFTNAILGVGGQATVGDMGVPAIVAQPGPQLVTVTTAVTVAQFTPPIRGSYRISGTVRINNGTSGNNVSLKVTYNDGITNSAHSAVLMATWATATTSTAPTSFSGSQSQGNDFFCLLTITVDAASGTPVAVVYQDPTNTPSDTLVITIERLS